MHRRRSRCYAGMLLWQRMRSASARPAGRADARSLALRVGGLLAVARGRRLRRATRTAASRTCCSCWPALYVLWTYVLTPHALRAPHLRRRRQRRGRAARGHQRRPHQDRLLRDLLDDGGARRHRARLAAGSVDTGAGGGSILLYSIAAAVIGGTSLFGGRGNVKSAVLGAIVIALDRQRPRPARPRAPARSSSSPASCCCRRSRSTPSRARGARRRQSVTAGEPPRPALRGASPGPTPQLRKGARLASEEGWARRRCAGDPVDRQDHRQAARQRHRRASSSRSARATARAPGLRGRESHRARPRLLRGAAGRPRRRRDLHLAAQLDARRVVDPRAEAGKHVLCEKPLSRRPRGRRPRLRRGPARGPRPGRGLHVAPPPAGGARRDSSTSGAIGDLR